LYTTAALTGFSSSATMLSQPRSYVAPAVIGQWLYSIGGYEATEVATIERAAIGSDGTLGAFTPLGIALPGQRLGVSLAFIGPYLYALGGQDELNGNDRVARASLKPDGTLGQFADIARTAIPRVLPATAVLGNQICLFGGDDSTHASTSTVQCASIAANGDLSAFATATNHLVTARSQASALLLGNNLYIVAGNDHANGLTSIEHATVTAGGAFGSLSTWSQADPHGPSSPACVVIGTSLFVMGGSNSTAWAQSSVDGSGGVGLFTEQLTPALIDARQDFGWAFLGNSLYLVGGDDNGPNLKGVMTATFAAPP
jgi:hypothetical protein